MARTFADAGEAAVRERLLAAAIELFTGQGYAATSVREIVAAAGVTKPALYYWFGSKEGLYLALVGSIAPLYEEQVARLTAGANWIVPGTLVLRSTETSAVSMFATARSGLPSPSKSPAVPLNE